MKDKVTLETLKSGEKEARRNIIIDAAERVFATKPFDRASMREIAEESGMSTSSIYRFFPNQESLLVAAAVRATRYFNGLFDEILSKYPPEKAFEVTTDSFIDFIAENDAFFSMMTIMVSQGNLSPDSTKTIEKEMNVTLDLIEKMFAGMKYERISRMLARHFYTSMIGIIVSYNKIPGNNRENVIQLMKRLAKMSYELILNCPLEKLEKMIG